MTQKSLGQISTALGITSSRRMRVGDSLFDEKIELVT